MRPTSWLRASARLRPLALLLGGALAPLASGSARAERPAPAAPAPEALALAAGQAAFACDLYRQLARGDDNLLLSPYSVQTALAMTRGGARGGTAEQLDRVLRLPGEGAPEAFRALVQAVSTAPAVRSRGGPAGGEETAYRVSVANGLFGQRAYPFVPAYRDLLASAYGAELRETDFAQPGRARDEINAWVLERTHEKIRDLIPAGLPTPDTRLVLVNAIHFLAPWDEPFSESATVDAPFTTAAGARVNVRLMRRTDRWGWYEDEQVQVLSLRYREGAVDMLVALPRPRPGSTPGADLAALEASLRADTLARWAASPRTAKVALGLPRFRFESANELSTALTALGLTDPFRPGSADFRGIADVPGEPLFIGLVLHKAFIAVDEKGTEAAAATAVMMRAGSVPRPEEPIPFVCDRPFLFALRHRATGALLFLGRLSRPEAVAPTASTGAAPGAPSGR